MPFSDYPKSRQKRLPKLEAYDGVFAPNSAVMLNVDYALLVVSQCIPFRETESLT